jgi:hypothetical protein
MPSANNPGKISVIFVLVLLFVNSLLLNAQSYWQQEVNYQIKVTLNDTRNELYGEEKLEYINHSPDELTFIYFHLWPNAYRNNNTAMAKQKQRGNKNWELFNDPLLNGYMDSLSFAVDGIPVKCEPHPEHNDICKLILPKPLSGGGKVIITTPFRVKIPGGGISRMGHMDQSYQITQWYPKPAVYDRKGWHPIPYLDQGEFYSEFGSFDVSISLPANYVVGATGELQTSSEIKWMNELAERDAKQDSFSGSRPMPKSDSIFKTIRFKEKKVHDFAWFADKGFRVLKGTVILPGSKDTVTTWSMFPERVGKYWKKSPAYIRDAVYYYSLWLGDYPYKNCTALEGPLGAGGGMEYPGITIVSSDGSDITLDQVITHEVGHNWLYGILGFNERDYPFLDEGINTYYEMRYMAKKYSYLRLHKIMGMPDGVGKFFELDHFPGNKLYELMYLGPATYRTDQPSTLKSTDYGFANYGMMVYMKSGLCFNYLKCYLGEAEFDRIMKIFYNTWKFKHPQPEDLQKIFEEHANKNVAWFFNDLLPTDKKMDYKIARLHKNEVLVKNKGSLATPIVIEGLKSDTLVFEKWYDGFSGKKWLPLPEPKVDQLALDNGNVTTELYRNNNYLRTKGLFRKLEPLKFKLVTTLDDYKYTTIQYMPVVAWNSTNKLMAGALLHNGFLLKKPFEYQLLPMYGFDGNKLAGMGNLACNFFPEFANIRILSFSLSAMQFAFDRKSDFNKWKMEARALFRTRDSKFYPEHIVAVNFSRLSDLQNPMDISYTNIFNLNYQFQNPKKENLTNVNYNFKANGNFGRTSLEVIYNLRPGFFKSPLTLRLFSGYMIYGQTSAKNIPFYLSGRTGAQDFEFEGLFPGRFDQNGMLSHQFMPGEGGFAVPYGMYANKFIVSAGFEFKLGSKGLLKLIKIYGNASKLRTVQPVQFTGNILYEGGIKAGVSNFFEVYFPVVYNQKYLNYSNYSELIRFNLNLKVLNPFTFMERIPQM